MASELNQIGTGSSISFNSTYFAQILDISWSGVSRAAIDTSHFGIAAVTADFGNKTFLPGDHSDPGELTVEFNFNPDTAPPIDAAKESTTVTFKDGATWTGSAFMTDFSFSCPYEDRMTATATLKFTTEITMSAGS